MALPQFRTYVLDNQSGVDLTFVGGGRVNVKETGLHANTTTGKIVYSLLADDDLGFTTGTLTDGAEIVGDSELDNTVNLFPASQIQLEITHDGGTAANGTFDLYLSSGDATGELQTDASGYGGATDSKLLLIGSLVWPASALDDEVVRSDIFHIG